MTYYVDLAEHLPSDIAESIGRLVVLFGRLEHMVLISLKRIRGISYLEAQKEYKSMTLGSMVRGASVCRGAEAHCRNRDAPPSLHSFADRYTDLDKLCDEINALTERRNNFVHGLIGFVIDEDSPNDAPALTRRGKIFELKSNDIHNLEESVADVILALCNIVPIDGLSVTTVTSGGVYVTYDESVITSSDPLAEKI